MGRAGRPPSGELMSRLRAEDPSYDRIDALKTVGLDTFQPGTPAGDAIRVGGSLEEDYRVHVLEADPSSYYWSVSGPGRDTVSGISSTEKQARQAAEANIAEQIEEHKRDVLLRQTLFQERKPLLADLRMPAGYEDLRSDPDVSRIDRQETANGCVALTYERGPASGYLLFWEGKALPLGDLKEGFRAKEPRGMWRIDPHRYLLKQAEEEMALFAKRGLSPSDIAKQMSPKSSRSEAVATFHRVRKALLDE